MASKLPAARKPANTGSKSRPMSMFEVPTDFAKRLQQAGDNGGNTDSGATSKQAKRRSLLPTFSRKASPEEKEGMGAIREDTSDSEVSSRPGTRDSKAMPPPPKPTRSHVRTPTMGLTSRTAPSHSRTTSRDSDGSAKPRTSTTSPPKFESGLKRAGSTRLPGASGQVGIPTRGSSTRAATSSTTAQKRATAPVSKPPATENTAPLGGSDPASPSSPDGSVTSRQSAPTNGVGKKMLPPPSRPTFSTYQQHYSPAKSALPKPPIPTAKASKPATTTTTTPTSTETDLPLTLDTALSQIELLQLSLLHQTSTQTLQTYTHTAKQKLSTHHASLRQTYTSLRPHEQSHRRTRNLSALETWCPDAALLAEHLQILNRVVSDLRGHTDPGSRYSSLTGTFDAWATKAETTLLDGTSPVTFIEALPESWRATHTSLALKLRSIQRDIGTMPPAPPVSETESPSSLDIVLESCSTLVESMLKELEVMTKLQKEVLRQGKARIDEQINSLITASERSAEKENWVPAWQSVT